MRGGETNFKDDAIARRLRVLGSVCAALTVAVLATAAAIGWAAAGPGAGDLLASPPFESFLTASGAMLLVLLASAVHGRILRRQAAAELDEAEEAEAPAAARLRAYSWATGASFGMLAVSAALGALVASAGKAPFYGLVICIAALLAMAARWPRRSGFDMALRPDGPETVSRAAAWRSLAEPLASHAADRRAAGDAGRGTEAGAEAADGGAAAARAGGGTAATAGSEAGDAARGGIGAGPR